MIKVIDNLLNKVTMYRLTLYGLIVLLFFGLFLQGFGLIFSTAFILITAYLTNIVFSEVYKVKTNSESFIITSLILSLIVSPPKSLPDLFFIFWVAVLAISSKFIFVYKKKHVINPAAIAIILTSMFIGSSASWWIGNIYMLVPTTIVGLLLIRKLKRQELFFSFVLSTFVVSVSINLFKGFSVSDLLLKMFAHTPLIFFSAIMLTEPLTLPPTKRLKIFYGLIAGIFFAPNIRILGFAPTPEIALAVANIYSFLVSFKERIIFKLTEKIKIGHGIYDFVFESNSKFNFIPGQYMEFTLPQAKVDSRGMRRYFSFASSPTEEGIRLGVKFHNQSSSFKNTMLNMNTGDTLTASNIDGDFILPKNPNIKLAFLAGGIGITPFRSIVKNLIDTNQKRDIILIY